MPASASSGSVLVVGEAGAELAELAPLLANERRAAVSRALMLRAMAWAAEIAPGRVRELDPAAETLADAAERALGGRPEPLLIAWPRLTRWRPEHAKDALDDLARGCDVSVGPVFDGGLYLLAVARPLPQLLTLVADAGHRLDAIGNALDAVQRAGLDIGLLRAERGLRTPADVRAALADPLLNAELRSLLS